MITENDPDRRHYLAGVFYFNREDRRLFVPKRMGYGRTFNFARPSAWVIIAMLVAVIATRMYFRN